MVSHSLFGRDLSCVLDLDHLVVPLLGGHHPPDEEESVNKHGDPGDSEQNNSSCTKHGGGENDDNKGLEERVGDQASHANDDSSSAFTVVSSLHEFDQEEVEDGLGEVDEDGYDNTNDALCPQPIDHVYDVDHTERGDDVDTAHDWETAAAFDISLLVGSCGLHHDNLWLLHGLHHNDLRLLLLH